MTIPLLWLSMFVLTWTQILNDTVPKNEPPTDPMEEWRHVVNGELMSFTAPIRLAEARQNKSLPI